jgi:NadR type nicotinamide-nucleotide adenylyltransferase
MIEAAYEQCHILYVIVTEEQDEVYSAEQRADWIYNQFKDTMFIHVQTTKNDLPNTPQAWAERTKRLVPNVDVVFTSEDYGPPWAQALGVDHIHIDKERIKFPTSGTAIRADVLGNWNWLAPATKADLALRVVMVGAESTGSTTLTKSLARYYSTVWVPEFGREWWDARQFLFDASNQYEFDRLIDGQNRMADELAPLANQVLLCDTDNLVTEVFEERYLGAVSERTRMAARYNRPDLYIITGSEIPWVNDGQRESEKERDWMQSEMIRLVKESGVPYIEATGDKGRRMNDAIKRIDEALEEKLGTPMPITEVLFT